MSLDITFRTKQEEQGYCDCCGGRIGKHRPILFSTNITSNVRHMADEAGVSLAMWSPEAVDNRGDEVNPEDLLPVIKAGIEDMLANPQKYIRLQGSNNWGTYPQFLDWIFRFRDACEEYPVAKIEVDS